MFCQIINDDVAGLCCATSKANRCCFEDVILLHLFNNIHTVKTRRFTFCFATFLETSTNFNTEWKHYDSIQSQQVCLLRKGSDALIDKSVSSPTAPALKWVPNSSVSSLSEEKTTTTSKQLQTLDYFWTIGRLFAQGLENPSGVSLILLISSLSLSNQVLSPPGQ